MRFYVDENIAKRVVESLRESGHEVLYQREIRPERSMKWSLQPASRLKLSW